MSRHTYTDLMQVYASIENMTKEIIEETKKEIKQEAIELSKNIKADAPVRSSGTSYTKSGEALPAGTYKGGWTYKLDEETDKFIRYRVYNKSKQKPLVHLLEWGHILVNGGSARAKKHVIANRDRIEEKIVANAEGIIKNADIK